MMISTYIAYFIGIFMTVVYFLLILFPGFLSSEKGPLPAFKGEPKTLFAFIAIRQLFIGLVVAGLAFTKNYNGLLLVLSIGILIPISDLIDAVLKKKKGYESVMINLFFIALVSVAIFLLI